jgi:hypothetical protein
MSTEKLKKENKHEKKKRERELLLNCGLTGRCDMFREEAESFFDFLYGFDI